MSVALVKEGTSIAVNSTMAIDLTVNTMEFFAVGDFTVPRRMAARTSSTISWCLGSLSRHGRVAGQSILRTLLHLVVPFRACSSLPSMITPARMILFACSP